MYGGKEQNPLGTGLMPLNSFPHMNTNINGIGAPENQNQHQLQYSQQQIQQGNQPTAGINQRGQYPITHINPNSNQNPNSRSSCIKIFNIVAISLSIVGAIVGSIWYLYLFISLEDKMRQNPGRFTNDPVFQDLYLHAGILLGFSLFHVVFFSAVLYGAVKEIRWLIVVWIVYLSIAILFGLLVKVFTFDESSTEILGLVIKSLVELAFNVALLLWAIKFSTEIKFKEALRQSRIARMV